MLKFYFNFNVIELVDELCGSGKESQFSNRTFLNCNSQASCETVTSPAQCAGRSPADQAFLVAQSQLQERHMNFSCFRVMHYVILNFVLYARVLRVSE